MSPAKLRLKRTPAEQAERDARKAKKAARKAAKRKHRHDTPTDRRYDDYDSDSETFKRKSKRQRTKDGYISDIPDESDEEYGPQPSSSTPVSGSHRSHKPDYDYIRAQVEEERFREKLWGALGDDEHLDSIEASLNSYAHVPRRWRGGGMERMDDELGVDPKYMEDEDYAEWVRAGMWRRKHAAEHEEQMRRQAEHKARMDREKAVREETRRLERAEEDERRKRRQARERLRSVEVREMYEERWKALLAPAGGTAEVLDDALLGFTDVPWPIMAETASSKRSGISIIRIEDLTADAITAFLLPPIQSGDGEELKKERREKLREAMLRFHPDKFEGRIMPRVRTAEQEIVREAVGIVARTLNTLMGQWK